jgi:hypothetical protein
MMTYKASATLQKKLKKSPQRSLTSRQYLKKERISSENLEAVLKERKNQFRKLTEEAIPEALAQTGMTGFTMEDGSKIEVKPFYSASIPAARKAEAFEWLREHGMDDIIKNTVSVRFGRGEDELCSRLLNLLGEQGYPVEQAEKIEPMTRRG